jgi:NAD(P)-dependent dehydrogenase (short-subunit alcohol dehydrogenase family)
MDLGLRGRVPIVTGGSRGIGEAAARALAKEGANVVICARGLDQLTETAKRIATETGTEVIPVQADVERIEDVKRLVSTAVKRFGRVDILVNNAVNNQSAPLMELTDEDWIHHYNVKLVGYVRCVREVLPHMKANGWGRIINMAGAAARDVAITGFTSGAVNSAVTNFTKKLANDVAPFGITANTIHPSAADSQRRLEREAHGPGDSAEQVAPRRERNHPIGRPVLAEDNTPAVLFFASEPASAITGQVLSVDGGSTAGHYY